MKKVMTESQLRQVIRRLLENEMQLANHHEPDWIMEKEYQRNNGGKYSYWSKLSQDGEVDYYIISSDLLNNGLWEIAVFTTDRVGGKPIVKLAGETFNNKELLPESDEEIIDLLDKHF